jgi:hypothetical protein
MKARAAAVARVDDQGDAELTASYPRGTSLRAVLTQSQAGRLYLAGTSRVVQP